MSYEQGEIIDMCVSERYEISVLISTYNDRKLVDKKLREVEAQTAFSRAEFIFVEAASPGNERELLEPFCEQYENCRLITLEKRISLYRAWNIGWIEASAPLACISNMDDMMHPKLLEFVLDSGSIDSWDVATVLIAKQSANYDSNLWDYHRLNRLDLSKRPGPFFAWKLDLASDFGYFDTRFEIGGDKDFWSRVSHCKLRIKLIPKILYLYTKHPSQLSKKPEFRQKKLDDRQVGNEKEYPHAWPVSHIYKMRLYCCLRRIPFLRRLFLA